MSQTLALIIARQSLVTFSPLGEELKRLRKSLILLLEADCYMFGHNFLAPQ